MELALKISKEEKLAEEKVCTQGIKDRQILLAI
jgi:hypothetical protein